MRVIQAFEILLSLLVFLVALHYVRQSAGRQLTWRELLRQIREEW